MSSGASRKGAGLLLGNVVLLGAFGAIVFGVTRVAPDLPASAWTIAAVGLLAAGRGR